MSESWKTQQQLDEEAELLQCNKPDPQSTEDIYGQAESYGIGTPGCVPFLNETGKPSIAVDFGGKAELRDGSVKKPIQLTGMQKFSGTKFKYIIGMREDGTMHAIKPPNIDCEYKLVADIGGFKFEKNITKNEFDPDDIYSGDKPEFVIGGKITTNACGDQSMRLAVYDISDLLDILQVGDCD